MAAALLAGPGATLIATDRPPAAPAAPTPDSALPADHPLRTGAADSPLIRSYRGIRTRHRPIWMMRQAGRSLPEYRALRVGTGMLEACLTPELVAEITCQ
ncbi:MAG: uroporphyrinogen decarboxylase family protein, partial [Propionicimonas sp.]|nr:uroporphyrinogen decarboxylase family protein [Propionicimonas sp.]